MTFNTHKINKKNMLQMKNNIKGGDVETNNLENKYWIGTPI